LAYQPQLAQVWAELAATPGASPLVQQMAEQEAQVASNFYPLPHPVKAIGVPYQGTHARAFNKSGGSDNWESENAVDLPTPKGTPVYAVQDGTIGKQIGSLGTGDGSPVSGSISSPPATSSTTRTFPSWLT
jgi:murein DD-endopeptidase MepM/ murein hydrolase activator NlpD